MLRLRYSLLACLMFVLISCRSIPMDREGIQVFTATVPASDTPMPTKIIETATPQQSPEPTRTRIPTLSPFNVLEPEDGGVVQVEFDNEQALPMVSVRVKYHSHHNCLIYLDADGYNVRLLEVNRDQSGQPVNLEWTPWHGNGEYRLVVGIYDRQDEVVLGQETLTVNVTGIPEDSMTVEKRIIEAYKDWFGINVPHPSFLYYSTYYQSSVENNGWVSTVFLQDRFYEIHLFDAGVPGGRGSQRLQTDSQEGFCRPEGHYEILVVVVEYAASRIDVNQVMNILSSEDEIANERWAVDAKRAGLNDPILSIDATVIGPISPPREGELLTPEEVHQLTGVDPHQYDLLFEVDLDPYQRSMSKYHARAAGLSFANRCKPGGREGVNAFMVVTDPGDLDSLGKGLYQHELHHLMGWTHYWPSWGSTDQWVENIKSMPLPSVLYGWRDIDGDGHVEIYDPDPYGINMDEIPKEP